MTTLTYKRVRLIAWGCLLGLMLLFWLRSMYWNDSLGLVLPGNISISITSAWGRLDFGFIQDPVRPPRGGSWVASSRLDQMRHSWLIGEMFIYSRARFHDFFFYCNLLDGWLGKGDQRMIKLIIPYWLVATLFLIVVVGLELLARRAHLGNTGIEASRIEEQ